MSKKKRAPRVPSKRELNEKLRNRLKDVLCSLRHRFRGQPVVQSIDRIMPLLVFNRTLSRDSLINLFISRPARAPEDFQAVLIREIETVTLAYWSFIQREKQAGYKETFAWIISLEHVARDGFDAYRLDEDRNTGFVLVRKE